MRQRSHPAVRGGYGIFYFLDRGGVGNELSNNPEFNGTSTYTRRTATASPSPGKTPPRTACVQLHQRRDRCDYHSLNATRPPPEQIVNIDEAAPTNANVIAYPKHNPTSMIQEWNMQVEQQLDSNTAMDIAYVGTKSDHLPTPSTTPTTSSAPARSSFSRRA